MADLPWEIKLKKFLSFLELIGLEYKGRESSHMKYDFPRNKKQLSQPVIVDQHGDMVPRMHVLSNLKTINISPLELEKYLKNKKYKPKTSNKYYK